MSMSHQLQVIWKLKDLDTGVSITAGWSGFGRAARTFSDAFLGRFSGRCNRCAILLNLSGVLSLQCCIGTYASAKTTL